MFFGMPTVKLVDTDLVLLRSKKVALFLYCVSPSAYRNVINKKLFQLIVQSYYRDYCHFLKSKHTFTSSLISIPSAAILVVALAAIVMYPNSFGITMKDTLLIELP